MDLKKVYNSTEDLFDSADSIYGLFNVYFDSADKKDFFGSLRDTESNFMKSFAFPIETVELEPRNDLKNPIKVKIKEDSAFLQFLDQNNQTHCILFNKWLNDIRRISGLSVDEKNKFYERVSDASHEIKSLTFRDGIINSYRVKAAFNKISNKVKKMGTISQESQIDVFKASFRDNDVTRVMEILDYFSTTPFEKVINIKTNNLLAKEPVRNRNSVFLAVIPQAIDVYAVVNEYLKKCIKYNIPYDIDIPYDERTKRLIKFNSTIENLGKNIVVLKEIEKEHPEMIKRMSKPPVLCGHLTHDSWLGIGTYSAKAMERTTYGYTEKRAGIIYDVIEENSKQFIIDRYKKPFLFNGKDKKLKNHIADITTDLCIGKIRTMVEDYYETMEADHTPEEAEEQVKNYFGFERIDLYRPKYLKKLEKCITSDIDRMIMGDFEKSEGYGSFRLPSPGFGNGRILHMEVLPQIIRKVTSEIAIKDPIFLSQTILDMQSRLQEQGINKKMCYEDYVVDKLLESNEPEVEKSTQVTSVKKNKDDKEEIR